MLVLGEVYGGCRMQRPGTAAEQAAMDRDFRESAPPPPRGHLSTWKVAVLWTAAAFGMIFTMASAGVFLEAILEDDIGQAVTGMGFVVVMMVVTMVLFAWLMRVHRRRRRYNEILDAHYASRYGHDPSF